MPHIKEIRLVNVHFNNATQFYDDFKMKLEGKNASYDLENGGGKSLLLLMLLQTVLPKSYLRKEKSVSLLFQGGKDRTSHVAVELMLEEGGQYKYLLTGFSARKRRSADNGATDSEGDENVTAGDIEHINWCVFYNDNKITGIRSVPLCSGEAGRKIYAGFDEIRRFIQQVKQKGLPAEIFDGIDKYQSFISVHQLIPAEWNIIRGINSGENTIESYFRQNPTSRKLIENQFLKIIEDMEAMNKGEKNNAESLLLADTLIEIRMTLGEYLKLKGHMAEFEKIKEYYTEFGNRNDELLENFLRSEGCRNQAAAVRNLISQRLQQLKDAKAEVIKKIEEKKAGVVRGNILLKLLQAGLVTFEMTGLKKKKAALLAEQDDLRKEHEESVKKYFDIMAMEEYEEYRNVKSSLLKAQKSLSVLETDKDKINEDYRQAGGKFKYLLNQYFSGLQAAVLEKESSLEAIKGQMRRKNEGLIEYERQGSALEAEIKPLEEKASQLSGFLDTLQKYFMGNGEIDALINPKSLIEAAERQKTEYELQQTACGQRINDIVARLQELEIGNETVKGEIRLKEQLRDGDYDYLAKYQEEFQKLTIRAQGFNKPSLDEYREELEIQVEREGIKKLQLEIESGRLRQKKQLSERWGHYVPNEELIAFADAISKKCDYVKTGIDWITQTGTAEEKETILNELPFLPFSVIVDGKSFEKLKNGRIKTDFTSDYPIPLVNLETVRGMKNPAKEDIFYICSFAELLVHEDRFIHYIKGIDERLGMLEDESKMTDGRAHDLKEDLHTLSVFMKEYPDHKVEENIKEAEKVEAEISELAKKLTLAGEENARLKNEKTQVEEKWAKLQGSLNTNAERLDKLRGLVKYQQERDDINGELNKKKTARENTANAISEITGEVKKLEGEVDRLNADIGSLRLQLHDMEKEKGTVESFTELENDRPPEEIRSEFTALEAAIGGKLDDEKRLRRDIKDFTGRLSKSQDRILRDYETNLENIWESEKEGTIIIIPTKEAILKAKSDKENIETQLDKTQKSIAAVDMRISKFDGEKGEILKGIPESETKEPPTYESEKEYRDEIGLKEGLVESCNKELGKLEGELRKIDGESSKMDAQAVLYDSFIQRTGVTIASGVIAAELKDFRMFEEEYVNLERAINQQLNKWRERITAIRQETAAFVITVPLEELAKISLPESAAQCGERQGAFREYVGNIDQQIQKIGNDILQLESYQQNFIRRCIQRAELVLGQLRKMDALSKIEVNGRRVNIVEVKINEFENKEKEIRMKNHIDSIVREISEGGTVDRNRVAFKLSTKELLAQVADMDKAVVRLYKIESIPENSRFYRWENAIGSEGQNNSLYFIFAACLISFIRMLTITNTSLNTKKVIIADNPFGATSAVYLWDPMFQIMKQNHIQLIAPGHRIPREITSRFGVNYLLNQDILQDGRMRVVVKDVRSEEDEEVMRYVDPEQLTMF